MSKLTIENNDGKVLVKVNDEPIGLIQEVRVLCKANDPVYQFEIDVLDVSEDDMHIINDDLKNSSKRSIELLSSVKGISLKRSKLSCANETKTQIKNIEYNKKDK